MGRRVDEPRHTSSNTERRCAGLRLALQSGDDRCLLELIEALRELPGAGQVIHGLEPLLTMPERVRFWMALYETMRPH